MEENRKPAIETIYILPTGNEIQNGVVLDLDSPEVMGQLLRAWPRAEVTRLCPLADEEEAILEKLREVAALRPDLIVLIGGSGGGHRHSDSLGKDYTQSALELYLKDKSVREIYGKNGHLWCKLLCGRMGNCLLINVPGPFHEARAAIGAFIAAAGQGGGLKEINQAMAEAVFSQYPPGRAESR